jgi:hypothetical protein
MGLRITRGLDRPALLAIGYEHGVAVIDTSAPARLEPLHASAVTALSFSRDGRLLAAGGRTGLVTVYELG